MGYKITDGSINTNDDRMIETMGGDSINTNDDRMIETMGYKITVAPLILVMIEW